MGEADIKQYDFLNKKMGDFFAERLLLTENLDIEFLLKLEKIVEDLIEKNRYIKGVLANGGESQFKKDFLPLSKKSGDEGHVKAEDIAKITVEPFDVIFDISKKGKDGVNGRHYFMSPFISLFAVSEHQRDFVVRHEKIHNILGSVEVGQAQRGFRRFKNSYERYGRCKNLNAPEYIISHSIGILKKIDQFGLIDEHHEEILAGIEHAYSMGFKHQSPQERSLEIIFGESEDVDRKFFKRAASLSTAGRRMIDNDKELLLMEKKESNPQVKEIIQELRERFKSGVINMVGQIKEATDVAGMLGPEAEEKLYILFLMLQPTKYRHIKTYFESIYGKDFMEQK